LDAFSLSASRLIVMILFKGLMLLLDLYCIAL